MESRPLNECVRGIVCSFHSSAWVADINSNNIQQQQNLFILFPHVTNSWLFIPVTMNSHLTKKGLRAEIRSCLREMTTEDRKKQSEIITQKVNHLSLRMRYRNVTWKHNQSDMSWNLIEGMNCGCFLTSFSLVKNVYNFLMFWFFLLTHLQ